MVQESHCDARGATSRRVGLWRTLFGLSFLPRGLRFLIFSVAGVCCGLAIVVVHISRAPSYLSDEPEVCVNCHVMRTEYVTWQHSSHREVAHCNDCHVPNDSFFRHWLFKAEDGLWHSTVFTMRWEPQVIELSERAVPVVEENCRRCHEKILDESPLAVHRQGDLRCWECHREVPHGRVRSLASTPGYLDPALPPIDWKDSEVTIGGRPARDKGEGH
ncbi:hypothetical protein JCM19992_11710 [Thermostilla marina]